jgi:hypothetical protein
MDLGDIGWSGMDWYGLDQDRDKWGALVKCSNEPSGSITCWEVLEWLQQTSLVRLIY